VSNHDWPVLPYQPDPLGHVRIFFEQQSISVWMNGIGLLRKLLGYGDIGSDLRGRLC